MGDYGDDNEWGATGDGSEYGSQRSTLSGDYKRLQVRRRDAAVDTLLREKPGSAPKDSLVERFRFSPGKKERDSRARHAAPPRNPSRSNSPI